MEEEKKEGLTAEQKKTIKNVLIGIAVGSGLCGLAIIPLVCSIYYKHRCMGYSNFASIGGGIIPDEAVKEYVKKHSRLIDRLNPGKMVDMTFGSLDILGGKAVPDDPKDENWRFAWNKNNVINVIYPKKD